jgi:hypothetical protein
MGGAKKMNIARRIAIPRQVFIKAMTFIRTKPLPNEFFYKYITGIGI